MRSSVVRENDHPFRFAKDVFGSGFFTGAVLYMASVRIEDEDGTVLAGDLDRLAGVGALVEQVAAWVRIVVGNPFPERLPRWFDVLECLDVEGRGRWWRPVRTVDPLGLRNSFPLGVIIR